MLAPPVFVSRTSDWNGPAAPFTCVITGMISVFGGGKVLRPGATGVTRLSEKGRLPVWPLLVVTVTVPVFAPGGSADGFAVTFTLTIPFAGTVPLDGVTVRYG